MLIIFVSVFPRTWVDNTYALPRSYKLSSARADAKYFFSKGLRVFVRGLIRMPGKLFPEFLVGASLVSQVAPEKFVPSFPCHRGLKAKYLLVKMTGGAQASRMVKSGVFCPIHTEIRANPSQWA